MSSSVSRTSASEPDSPGTSTLVESQTIASTPSSPARISAASSVVGADQRVGVELPVAGMHDAADRGLDDQRVGLRDRMGQRDQLDIEGTDGKAPAQRDHRQRHAVQQAGLGQLAAQHRRRERRRVDRAAEPVPEIGDRAEMVLMRVGQHEADQLVAALLDEGRVGHDDVDAGRRLVAEGDAEIDHQPAAGMAVKVQVHADLARPAERQEQELVVSGGAGIEIARHRLGVSPVDQLEPAQRHVRGR